MVTNRKYHFEIDAQSQNGRALHFQFSSNPSNESFAELDNDWPASAPDDGIPVFIPVTATVGTTMSTADFMAAGPLLPNAIEDLAALPKDAYERSVAEQILLNLKQTLGIKPDPTPDEQEFLMTMHSTWDDARKMGRKEGFAEGPASPQATSPKEPQPASRFANRNSSLTVRSHVSRNSVQV